MAAMNKETHAAHSDSLIGKGTVVVGNIVVSGGLRVDGEVRGNVSEHEGRSAILVIGEKGRVDGDIEVARLTVHGLVTGRVYAKEFLEVQSKGHVTCDVEYGAVEIRSGAIVQGRLTYRRLASQEAKSQEAA